MLVLRLMEQKQKDGTTHYWIDKRFNFFLFKVWIRISDKFPEEVYARKCMMYEQIQDAKRVLGDNPLNDL